MKTTLTFTKKQIPGIPAGSASRFPALRDPIKSTIEARLDEDDGLFVNYGMFSDSLPYAMQDDYDLSQKQTLEFDSAILENDFLRAEFVLPLGGRLWSLFDKTAGRELLTANTEFRPCNLAIRNAWFAGGVEFNCGRRGHDVNTCSPRFAAELDAPEFGPVLRIYDYSRDRKTPFQIDFLLPGNSHFLFARGRIYNPGKEVVPMYWWSNIAAPMTPGCRVVVPAMETYLNKYDQGSHFLTKTSMPDGEGFDQTYPENFPFVRDHFYNIPAESRKYEALFNRDGSGFIHLSTKRLQGRKLFVWGKTSGGANWQRKLLGPGVQDYLELQAGLAKTQQECLPMPPRTAWEWLEAYGGIQAEPADIFGSWEHAVQSVTALADELLPEPAMDDLLRRTRPLALRRGTLRMCGNGAAALEEKLIADSLAPHLDFGQTGPDEKEWVELCSGRMDDEPPRSFQVSSEWIPRLLQAPECWKKHYHLALCYFRTHDEERLEKHSLRALELARNAWTLHLRANVLLRAKTHTEEALDMLTEAALLPEADAYLVKETAKLLVIHGEYSAMLDFYHALPQEHRNRPTVRLQYAAALFRTGNPQEALDILTGNGGLELPDAREGDIMISHLYLEILKALGLTEAQCPMPLKIDYRTK